MKKKTLVLSLLMSACLLGKTQYANQTLSNLIAPTAVNKDFRPGTHNAYNLGEPSKSWKNLSLTGILYLKSEPFLRILGTGGTFAGINAGGSSTGSFNTGFGYNTLFKNTTGGYNTANGYNALYSNTTGSFNTANGCQALYSNTIGEGNTATGYQALFSNSTGRENIAYGYQALYGNTIGSGNTAIGNNSLFSNSTGSYNTATGWGTLRFNTTGQYNTATGHFAMFYNTTASDNAAYGYKALALNNGSSNTAMGSNSLFANGEGSYNSAYGSASLQSNRTGSFNTAIGQAALTANTAGEGNTATGNDALRHNISGSVNTVSGYGTMWANETGSNNTAFGGFALTSSRYASFNTTIGTGAMLLHQTGDNNTAIGNDAGNVMIGGSAQYDASTNACTFLGANSNVGSSTQYNTTVIGYNARAAADNQVVIGNTSVNSIGGYANWTNFSDARYKKNVKENVPGLSFINELRAVTYTLDIDGVNKTNPQTGKTAQIPESKYAKIFAGKKADAAKETEQANKAVSEKSKIVYTGFLAQEVETAAKKLDYDFSGVKKPENDKDFYGLRYAEFVVPLVKAVQELSADNDAIKKQNEVLKVQNEKLEAQNEKLEARLAAIEQMLGAKNGLGMVTLSNNSLGQNIPNPANGKMTIPFSLSSTYQRASIVITEVASGKTLKTIAVTPGQKSITVQLDNIASGTYAYSLVADNKILESKKMVVAR